MNRIVSYITRSLLFISLILWFSGCAILGSSSSNATADDYYEDISVYRPLISKTTDSVAVAQEIKAVTVEPTHDVTAQLDLALDSLAAFRQEKIQYVDGYTIQIFVGSSRAEASEAQMKVYRNFPDLEPKMTFDQPNYKVQLGSYYTRLNAQPIYLQIKEVFRRAILVPTKLRI